jgi:hypothetical protein
MTGPSGGWGCRGGNPNRVQRHWNESESSLRVAAWCAGDGDGDGAEGRSGGAARVND